MSTELKIKYINPNLLKPYPNNPRTIGEEEMEGLKASLSKFGFAEPLAINKNNEVIGGNQRRQAAIELNTKKVPTTLIVLPIEEERALNVELNNKHIAGDWTPALAELLGQIKMDMPETYEALRLEPLELDVPEIDIGGGEGGSEGEADVPEPAAESIIQAGDLVTLGKHKLLCGDSIKAENVKRLMDGKKADMVYTDPPYGMRLDADYSGEKSNLKMLKGKNIKGGRKYNNVIGDEIEFDPSVLMKIFDYCKEQFWWGADYYSEKIPNKNDGSWLVWDKRLDESADKMYGSCFELCWSKTKHKRYIARIKWAGVFGTEKEPSLNGKKRFHPTQKPINLAKWFYEHWGKENDIVADIFLGSGSTLIACEQLNRICYGMEIAPEYVQVATERWINYTDKPEDVTVERDGQQYKWSELNGS